MTEERHWREQHGPGGDSPAPGSGDVAMRQLRRRYESLREDYEQLLDRLGELEARMEQPGAGPANAARPEPRLGEQVQRAIVSPIYALRDEYASAAAEMQMIATSLEDAAQRAFKGQRPAREATLAPAPAATPEPPTGPATPVADEPAPEFEAPPARGRDTGPQTTHIEVASPNLGTLLDFQERLSRLGGVARVSMSQVTADRAMLLVELQDESAEEPGAPQD